MNDKNKKIIKFKDIATKPISEKIKKHNINSDLIELHSLLKGTLNEIGYDINNKTLINDLDVVMMLIKGMLKRSENLDDESIDYLDFILKSRNEPA